MELPHYIQDEILQYVRQEVEWQVYLGGSFEVALANTRQAMLDAIDVSLIVTGLLRDFERNSVAATQTP